MKSALFFTMAAAGTAAALPAVTPRSPLRFTGMSLRSASAIHFGSINANGQQFWIGKDTATYCPGSAGSACDGANSNTTVFAFDGRQGSTLGLSIMVPGGQYIYVTEGDESTPAGQLRFTQAHSASTVGTPIYEGFSIANETLQFEGDGWLACLPADDSSSAYAILAASRANVTNTGMACLGFNWRVVDDNESPPAWQYV